MRTLLLMLLIGWALQACAVFQPASSGAFRCTLAAPGVLNMSGVFTPDSVRCVEIIELNTLETIRVDSHGGNVRAALALADALAPHRPHVVVTGACNSSCANYILPIAGRITLERGATVLLHGSIDSGFIASLEDSQSRARELETARLQAEFAARYGVPYGWLLYREADAYRPGQWGDHVSGAPEEGGEAGIRMILVEEAFLRSCLTGAQITPFAGTLDQRAANNPRLRARLAAQGIALSGSLLCIQLKQMHPHRPPRDRRLCVM